MARYRVEPDGRVREPLNPEMRGPGLRVRFSAIRGVTSNRVLRRALYLPCILGDLELPEEFGITDYDTVSAGEFSTADSTDPTARRLRSVDLETLNVDWHRWARWSHNRGLSIEDLRDELTAIGRARTAFDVLATMQVAKGAPSMVRWPATMRELATTLKAGEADTRYWRIGLREWRDGSVERLGRGRSEGAARRKLPTTIEITRATTLRSIARHFFGSDASIAAVARAVCKANGLGTWPSTKPLHEHKRLKVGSRVKVPRPPEVFAQGPTTTYGGIG